MASLDLCYYKNGQRVCPPSQPIGSTANLMTQQADSSGAPALKKEEKPDKAKVRKAVQDMLDQYLPDPPEGWTLSYIP